MSGHFSVGRSSCMIIECSRSLELKLNLLYRLLTAVRDMHIDEDCSTANPSLTMDTCSELDQVVSTKVREAKVITGCQWIGKVYQGLLSYEQSDQEHHQLGQ
jgi:hypothetical protein